MRSMRQPFRITHVPVRFLILLPLCLSLIPGCAFIPGHIKTSELRASIGSSPEPPRIINPLFQVQVGEIRDMRRDKQFAGNIRNKLGMITASITSDPDIGETIKEVVAAELGRKGIGFGPSPFILDVEIHKLLLDTVGATYSEVMAEVEIEVSLSHRDRGLIWSNTYIGQAITGVRQIERHFLVEVTADAIRQMARSIKQDPTVMAKLDQYIRVSKGSREPKREAIEEISMASDVDDVPVRRTAKRKAYAVVIGIEQYQQKLPKADFATHDAEIMGKYLIKTFGYAEENVVVLLNERATKTSLEKYIEGWLPDHVETDDTVFIYFSGHGTPNAKTGKAYVVPYDGDPAFVEKTGYSLDRLYDSLGALPAKEIVVMLDSCFSGAGGRSVIAEGMRPIVLSAENPLMAKGRLVVLAASSGAQVSSTYKQKGHGLLTYYFLKGLQGEADQNHDSRIELKEVYEYLKPEVERTARREFHNEQAPQLLGNHDVLGAGIVLIGETNR